MQTHYDDLQVARDAPPEVIKAAYRALSQRYHPDRNASPDATHVMCALNAAYAILGDSIRRRAYDRSLAGDAAMSYEAQSGDYRESTISGSRRRTHASRSSRVSGSSTIAGLITMLILAIHFAPVPVPAAPPSDELSADVGMARSSSRVSDRVQISSDENAAAIEHLKDRVRANAVLMGAPKGLETVVSVRYSSSGELLSARLARSSENRQWDEAVLRAVRWSGSLPASWAGLRETSNAFEIAINSSR